ncbi:hypothetical protein [Pseudoteredinibacter isoporae]|uniref:Uncharacterized protein n=1 Tax=Pseudoteredinibacter isoporae TaxID=570281 RepID=A0A7X0JTJ0_9GAMM|nr:hypothetical protein [Pseudoteredinibacter isoporae]MBB6521887.1 hypothetical protein [Pseudoteredinibacter isoporae]NHO87431.1 hypothetical protein [Pseudoteredinibacter isoporae]NIB24238.1 hypothetical protein [Pseudoteredinibacter isoporae]
MSKFEFSDAVILSLLERIHVDTLYLRLTVNQAVQSLYRGAIVSRQLWDTGSSVVAQKRQGLWYDNTLSLSDPHRERCRNALSGPVVFEISADCLSQQWVRSLRLSHFHPERWSYIQSDLRLTHLPVQWLSEFRFGREQAVILLRCIAGMLELPQHLKAVRLDGLPSTIPQYKTLTASAFRYLKAAMASNPDYHADLSTFPCEEGCECIRHYHSMSPEVLKFSFSL